MSDNEATNPTLEEEVPADEVAEGESEGEDDSDASSEGGQEDAETAPTSTENDSEIFEPTLSSHPEEYSEEQLGGPMFAYILSELEKTKPEDKCRILKYLFSKFSISGLQLEEHEEIEGDLEALITVQQYAPLSQYLPPKNKEGQKSAKQVNPKPWVNCGQSIVQVTSLKKVGVANIWTDNEGTIKPNTTLADGPAFYQVEFAEKPVEEDEEEDEDADDESSPTEPKPASKSKKGPCQGMTLPVSGRINISIYRKLDGIKKKRETIMTTQVRFNTGGVLAETESLVGQLTFQMPQFQLRPDSPDEPRKMVRTMFHSVLHMPITATGKGTASIGDITKTSLMFSTPLTGSRNCPQLFRVVTHTFTPKTAQPTRELMENFFKVAPKVGAHQGVKGPKSKGAVRKPIALSLLDYQTEINALEEKFVRNRSSELDFQRFFGRGNVNKTMMNAFKVVIEGTNYQQLQKPGRKALELANIDSFAYRIAKDDWKKLDPNNQAIVRQKLSLDRGVPATAPESVVVVQDNRPKVENPTLERLSNADLMREFHRRQMEFGPPPPQPFFAPHGEFSEPPHMMQHHMMQQHMMPPPMMPPNMMPPNMMPPHMMQFNMGPPMYGSHPGMAMMNPQHGGPVPVQQIPMHQRNFIPEPEPAPVKPQRTMSRGRSRSSRPPASTARFSRNWASDTEDL